MGWPMLFLGCLSAGYKGYTLGGLGGFFFFPFFFFFESQRLCWIADCFDDNGLSTCHSCCEANALLPTILVWKDRREWVRRKGVSRQALRAAATEPVRWSSTGITRGTHLETEDMVDKFKVIILFVSNSAVSLSSPRRCGARTRMNGGECDRATKRSLS